MTKRRPPRTLLELCVAQAGGGFRAVPRGARVCELVIEWTIASYDLGHVATTAEYAEWWAISERSGWRHRAAIHELFPDDELRQVVELCMAQVDARLAAGPRRRLFELRANWATVS